jgi:predicted PurR-regulated permease PerM
MAIRVIDVTEHEGRELRLVEPVQARFERRRLRQRWGTLGVMSLVLPFIGALVTLGVVR